MDADKQVSAIQGRSCTRSLNRSDCISSAADGLMLGSFEAHRLLLAGSTHAPLCSKAAVQSKLLKLSLPTPQRVQMTFNDLERKRIENAMSGFMAKRRPPVHVRSQLDIGYRLVGQSIEIFEIRPQWDDLSVIVERSFAKATYVKTQKLWKVFWMRSDLKWHGYKPVPTVSSIDEFVTAVDADPYCCFFG